MNLVYKVDAKLKDIGFGKTVIFAIQQLLAIMAATLVVPVIVGNGMSSAAALFGAGVGTLVYLLFTRGKSPAFLGSSFAFIGSMLAAFAGAISVEVGYLGLIIGAVAAGLVYVVIATVVHFAGVKWISYLMPAAVIGPTVTIIGLSLAGNAVGDLTKVATAGSPYLALLVGLITLAVTMLASAYGKKTARLIPFIIGILGGYAFALVLTLIGTYADVPAMVMIDFTPFKNLLVDGKVALSTFVSVPDFTFATALGQLKNIDAQYIVTVLVAYVPVAFVVFAEHIADHKNLSSIIGQDLLEEPGLARTLLGDGVGSMVGAFFGGCPNTTYGESVACVAITRNASVVTILFAAISFLNPFVAFVNSIPSCIMGGVCVALYGFIAVSGLKMVQSVDLGENKNLFVVSVILITGIGGLTVSFGAVTLTSIACALILGILTNLMLSKSKG